MAKVNVFEIKAKLSEYLDRAIAGERILICRHNKPVAELRPLEDTRANDRPIGPLPGRPTFEVPQSFFDPLPDDELEAWEGEDDRRKVTSAFEPSGAGASKVADGPRRSATRGRRPRRKSR